MAVQLQLLGLPRLVVDGRSIAVSWPRRTLALLAYLVTSNGAVPRDAAAFALWPDDDEEAARANLRRHLNALRGVLPPQVAAWIIADPGSLEFRHADADTDVAAFERHASRPAELAAAVAVYGGDFAQPLDDPWILTERERLRARFHSTLMELVGVEFSARRFAGALAYARRIAVDEPFREDIVRRIIAIRYAMGDRPGALSEFDRFARSLRAEMDIDPMPETAGLRDLVLRGEPLPFANDAVLVASAVGVADVPAPLLPFTGRRETLARLGRAWQAASGGAGGTIFVAGEAGIGKTRTIGEFLERTVGASARILRGATASPESRPYEALLSAFAQAAPFVPTLNLEPVWLAALGPLVPEIALRGPALAPQPGLSPEREVTRLFESFVRFVIALARGRAVALVLEDLHWSGTGTFDALRYVAGRLQGHRVLLVATYRSDESPAVETFARGLCASGHASSVALTRLDRAQTLELLDRAEPPVTGPPAAQLATRSAGHPLFLAELLREFREAPEPASGGIAELVGARLERCSPDARILARIAAVCGATFDLDLLQRVAGWDDGALVDGLAELLARQFIRSTAVHERGSYAFTHALVQNAVAGALGLAEQRRTHRIIARILEARADDGRSDVEIARHWAEAQEPQRAARAYLRAAETSLKAHARGEVAELATAGLVLATDSATRQRLLTLRIESNLRRLPAEMLRPDVSDLNALAGKADDDRRYEAALLGYRVEEIAGDIESREAAADVLRALTEQGPGLPQRAARLADVDAGNAVLRGNFDEAFACARRSVELYGAAGASRDELRASLFLVNVLARRSQHAAALALLAEIEPRVAALDDPALAMEFWFARSIVPHALRDFTAALGAAERLATLAQAAGDRLMEAHALTFRGAAFQHASKLSPALRDVDRAAEIYRSIGAEIGGRSVRNNRASLLLQIGRIDEAARLLRGLYADAKADGAVETRYFAASNLGCALFAAGDIGQALLMNREALELARGMGSEGFAALALGDLGAAEVAANEPLAGRDHLLEAAEINRRLGRPAVLAHDLARAAGAEPSARTGAEHARSALAIVEGDAGRIALAPEILNRCAAAFARAGDAASAAYCLRRANETLAERLQSIDGDDRASYLALPWHRSLVGAAAGGRREASV